MPALYADRIKARAIRRCGQLVKALELGKGGRPKTQEGGRPSLRNGAAKSAGLSSHQPKQRSASRTSRLPLGFPLFRLTGVAARNELRRFLHL
jgi:hypothetical protein